MVGLIYLEFVFHWFGVIQIGTKMRTEMSEVVFSLRQSLQKMKSLLQSIGLLRCILMRTRSVHTSRSLWVLAVFQKLMMKVCIKHYLINWHYLEWVGMLQIVIKLVKGKLCVCNTSAMICKQGWPKVLVRSHETSTNLLGRVKITIQSSAGKPHFWTRAQVSSGVGHWRHVYE